jgi:hypothetical protein
MRTAWQLTVVSVLACVITSCASQPPGEGYVRQKIPIEIQSGNAVTIEISSLSGNGVNDIGIRCSPEVWNALTNGTKSITVRLKSSNKPDTNIGGVDPSSGGTAFLGYIPNVHYLFYIGGRYRTKASVEITFANAPAGVTPAEIIVCKTPSDTGL